MGRLQCVCVAIMLSRLSLKRVPGRVGNLLR